MQYELGQQVQIAVSYEQGTVVARAEYQNSQPTYLVRYRDALGAGVEKWWDESALQPA